jgi:hypothetical protein
VGFIAADATADQAGRLPVPSTSDVANAVSIIQQAFEDDYKSAKESGNARPLIEKLVASVAETENPARKYAMLVEAERLAVESDAHQLALEVTDVRAEQFAIDGLKTRCEILSTMGTASPQAAAEVLDNATAMAKEAIQADRFDVATAAADLAVEVAKAIDKDEKKKGLEIRRKSKGKEQIPEPVGPRLVEQSETLRKQVGESQDLHKEFLAAGKTLEASPDDPSANTVAGKFLCFVKRDWEVGLKLLTKGTESEIKGLANRECTALVGPDGLPVDAFKPAVFLPVANAWWKLAEGDALRSESEQAAARAHAADLYERMLPEISDPVDIKLAEKRIAAVPEADRRFPAAQPAVATEMFLSDLPEINPVVGWGSFGKNGQMGWDGLVIMLNGKRSPKGISMHAVSYGASRVTYAVPKGARILRAEAAINDTARRRIGPLHFKVTGGDSTVLWQGPRALQGTGDSMPVEVDVSNQKTIQLVVECNGNSNSAWFEPRCIFESRQEKRTRVPEQNSTANRGLSGLSDLLDVDDADKGADSKGRSRRPARMTIPRDAFRFQGHSYYFFTVPASPREATQQCENAGGYLLRIDSDEEYDAMCQVLQNVRRLQRAEEVRVWIDGSDKATEGQWLYSDATPKNYFRWGPGQPDNASDEDFIELTLSEGYQAMNDLSDVYRRGCICEWDK